ncbi:MAG TPA: thioredoxin family protein [Ramlibacter sp.]|nr:thioredoxin family protein [Ramlibacter sp.]
MALMKSPYLEAQPSRAEVDALAGNAVLEFGTNWCGWCVGAQPHIDAALASAPPVKHIKAEDGPGRPLGRSYRVKLWPTLIFLRDGKEVARVVRPGDAGAIKEALAQLA